MKSAAPSSPEGLPRNAPDVPSRVRRAVIALVAIIAACGALGTALSPYLLVEHPLALVGLNPDSRHLVLAATRVEPWMLIAVGAPRRALSFIATYGLGALYGYMLIGWIERRQPWMQKLIGFAERLYVRWGAWLVLMLPIFSVAGLAGVGRLPFWKFVIAIIPGQIAWVTVMYYFGESISGWTDPIIAFLSDHLLASTLVCVVLVLAHQTYRRTRKREDDEPDVPF